jgi:hypothetical protein
MQIKIKILGVHAGKASSTTPPPLSRPLFANPIHFTVWC